MKPTVTIDLDEYKALKEIEDTMVQNKSGIFINDIRPYYYEKICGYAFVFGKDESLLLLQKEIDRLKALATERYLTIESMLEEKRQPKKKWWQL